VEEPLPAPRLEGVGGEVEEGGAGDEHRVGVVERPAVPDEVADADVGDAEEQQPEASVEQDLEFPVGEKPSHRVSNGAIGYADAKLRHSVGWTRAARAGVHGIPLS
jgi:hypothetical protein